MRSPHPLDIFYRHARLAAYRVAAQRIAIVDAVDMLHSAAAWSGLIDAVGEDRVQEALASAFCGRPRKGDRVP